MNNQNPERPESDTETPAAKSQMHLTHDVRSMSLAILAVLAVVFMLHWARAVFIPVMLGVIISYALSPLVDMLQKWRVPRILGTTLVMLSLVGGIGFAVWSLSDDAGELIETLPEAARNFRKALGEQSDGGEGAIEKVQEAATQLEQAARESTVPAPAVPRGVTRVQIVEPRLYVGDFIWGGTLGIIGFVGQITIVLFLTYFILLSGDAFRRKLVTVTGPQLSKKKITLQILDDIHRQIRRYLLVQLFTSIVVGIASWAAFTWFKLEHAAIWGISAGIMNSIPYLGPIIVTGGTAVVALLQFGTMEMALLISGTSLMITSFEGYLLNPWLSGKAGRMSALVVFLSVLFWGWLWGAWGLLLGVPIMMIIKTVCERVEDLKMVGELLGDSTPRPDQPTNVVNSP